MSDTESLDEDGVFKAAIGTLWFCGLCYLALGLCFPLLIANGLLTEPGMREPPAAFLWFFGVLMFGVAAACAAGNFLVAWGLAKRKKWAWVFTVIVGGLYAPSGCLPFGALLLYAMLRSGVKERFEAEAQERSGAPARF